MSVCLSIGDGVCGWIWLRVFYWDYQQIKQPWHSKLKFSKYIFKLQTFQIKTCSNQRTLTFLSHFSKRQDSSRSPESPKVEPPPKSCMADVQFYPRLRRHQISSPGFVLQPFSRRTFFFPPTCSNRLPTPISGAIFNPNLVCNGTQWHPAGVIYRKKKSGNLCGQMWSPTHTLTHKRWVWIGHKVALGRDYRKWWNCARAVVRKWSTLWNCVMRRIMFWKKSGKR